MQITLIANPPDAPCCVKIESEDGQSRLIQTDYDFPGVANTFGWSIQSVQWPVEDSDPCEHSGTDGTVPCPKCGMPASKFIRAARQWIDDHDGITAEDPGYFTESNT